MSVKKEDIRVKKELARMLYLNGDTQKLIHEKTGVSAVTINTWVKKEGWAAIRAAKNISRAEIVNKNLQLINKLLEELNSKDSDDMLAKSGSIVDKICKLASTIEKIDKKNNVVTEMEAFTAFDNWLISCMNVDPELTPDFIKKVNSYQNMFIEKRLRELNG
jgi:transposase